MCDVEKYLLIVLLNAIQGVTIFLKGGALYGS